ncbi:hypothetical protein PV08_09010 [Exophiala spinifera]|uniref:Uncharacterized protein n=1 Tax=Exophiala spinifera TaxID=91928 RepID=A0A0D2AYE4_9EURO|nr:uncharacterized protein PV08_09010 [Exophiala spinifera]KIW11738.1 hypothetical protein PV08_09010 [Exophiala spinifera]
MAITRHAQMNSARVLRSRRVTVTPVNPWSRPGRRSFHRPSTIPRRSISKRNPDPSDGLKEIFVSTFPESSAGDIFPERLSPSVGADDGDIHVSPMSNGKPSLPAPNLGSLPSAAVRPLAHVTSFEDAILTTENDSLLDPATVMPGCLSGVFRKISAFLPTDSGTMMQPMSRDIVTYMANSSIYLQLLTDGYLRKI